MNKLFKKSLLFAVILGSIVGYAQATESTNVVQSIKERLQKREHSLLGLLAALSATSHIGNCIRLCMIKPYGPDGIINLKSCSRFGKFSLCVWPMLTASLAGYVIYENDKPLRDLREDNRNS